MHTHPMLRNKQPKHHAQAHSNPKFLNINTSSHLGEILSPGRVTLSPKQQQTSLRRAFDKTNMNTLRELA